MYQPFANRLPTKLRGHDHLPSHLPIGAVLGHFPGLQRQEEIHQGPHEHRHDLPGGGRRVRDESGDARRQAGPGPAKRRGP